MDDVPEVVDLLPRDGFVLFFQDEIRGLHKPFSTIEVKEAVWSMGRFKAPEPDEYQTIFYQECWEVVGESVVCFVLDFLRQVIYPQTK